MCTVFSYLETRNTHSHTPKLTLSSKLAFQDGQGCSAAGLVPFHPLQNMRTSAIPTVP